MVTLSETGLATELWVWFTRRCCLTDLHSFPALFGFSSVGHENKNRCVAYTGKTGRHNTKIMVLCKKKNYVKWWNNKYFKLLENHFFPLLVKILYLAFNLKCLLGERYCKAPWDYCKTGKHRTIFEVSTSSFIRNFLHHHSVTFKGRKRISCQMIYRWNYFYLQKCAFLKWISLIFPLHLPFEYNSCPLQLDPC